MATTSTASTIRPLSVGNSPPIPTFAIHRDIQGVPTQLTIQTYDDRILVLLTQLGNKVGCLTQASLPASIPLTIPKIRQTSGETDASSSSAQILSMLPPPSPSISLLPLIGAPLDQTQNDFYVSQIATVVWWLLETAGSGGTTSSTTVARRSVVIGLALARASKRIDEEDEDVGEQTSVNDREGFAQIVSMIAEWPGL